MDDGTQSKPGNQLVLTYNQVHWLNISCGGFKFETKTRENWDS